MTFEEFRPPFASARLSGVEFNIEENADYRASDWAQKYIGGRKPIGFAVDNLEEFIANVKAQGVTVLQEPVKQSWGWFEAVITDIDGNEFVIEQEI